MRGRRRCLCARNCLQRLSFDRTAQNRGEAPSPGAHLRCAPTSPRTRGEVKKIRVLATHPAPEFCSPPRQAKKPSRKEGRRSAERRIQPLAAPHIRASPSERARARQRPLRGPLASRRSAAALTEVTLGSASVRVSWNYRMQTGGPSPAPVQRATRGPVVVPADRFPKPPGSGLRDRAREPHSLRLQDRLAKAPFDERDLTFVTELRPDVK